MKRKRSHQVSFRLFDKEYAQLQQKLAASRLSLTEFFIETISKVTIFIAVTLVFALPVTVSANSSWHWISSQRPLDLLPLVIVITLAIEIVAINSIAKVRNLKRVVPVVVIANLVSFLIPYIWLGISPDNVYSAYLPEYGLFFAIEETTRSTPTFTVSVFYLCITLLVEVPIVFVLLRKKLRTKRF